MNPTTDPTPTTPTTHSSGSTPPPAKASRTASAAIVAFLRGGVPRWTILVGILIGAFLYDGLADNQRALDSRQRAADTRRTDAEIYALRLIIYNDAGQTRERCLAVVRSDRLNRGQHAATIAAIEAQFPPSDERDAFVAVLRAGPLLASDELDETGCPDPPTEPEVPPSLAELLPAEITDLLPEGTPLP